MQKILAIEDSKVAQAQLLDILEGEYLVTLEENGASAMAAAVDTVPDLILLDVNLPGMNGYDICRQLKGEASTREIPVIFLRAIPKNPEGGRAGRCPHPPHSSMGSALLCS